MVVPIIVIALAAYFVLGLYVLPEQYIATPANEPKPILNVQLSNSEISLGSSFDIELESENVGDFGDILIVSVAFPELEEVDESIKIVSYDFTQSPQNIAVGEEIGAEYTGGLKSVFTEYPSIEAYSRPADPGSKYHMTLEVTPKQTGDFVFYTKTIALPHFTDEAHYPNEGMLDHQGEYVEVYSVNVKP